MSTRKREAKIKAQADAAYEEALRKSPAMAIGMALMQGMTPPKKAKRQPLLIDEALNNPHKGAPKDVQKRIKVVQARLRNAKVFKFDEDAALYAAQMMRNYPEAIAHDIEYAIPPFKQMYIEFPFMKFYDMLTPPEMRGLDPLPIEDQDLDVGYFYDGPTVYVMSRTMPHGNSNSHGMLLPLRFRLNRTFTFQEEQQLTKHLQGSRLSIDAFFWGSCYKRLIERNDYASMRALRDHHSCEVWYGIGDVLADERLLAHLLHTNAGDMRTIIAMLLFLNRTKDVQVVDELPPAPGWIRAKPSTLVRHNLIHIKLDPGPLLKRAFKSRATGGWRREHDVRGHFCHDRVWHNAHHEHDARETRVNHWQCVKCGGAKWWRKEHHRGRADLGQVRTVYEVAK
jgi:hypothetical protein